MGRAYCDSAEQTPARCRALLLSCAQDSRGVRHKCEGGTTLLHMMETFPRAWHLLECHKVLS